MLYCCGVAGGGRGATACAGAGPGPATRVRLAEQNDGQRVATTRMSQESLMELLECQGQQDRAPRAVGQVKDMKGARWHPWICLLRVFSSCSSST